MTAPLGDVVDVIGLTAAAYVVIFVATRVAGRRTLAQLSAFDVVITIALGTLLGSTAVSSSVSLAEGSAAVLTLVSLQVVLGMVRRRSSRLRRWLDFRPITVVEDGQTSLPRGVFGPQLTIEELQSQLRLRGDVRPEHVRRAVLEPVGGVSVVVGREPPRTADGPHRSTREVLESHLARRQAGDLEADLADNYAEDVALLSAEGVHHGHDGVRKLAQILRSYVPDGSYHYQRVLTDGEVGLLRWSATDPDIEVHDGADSYVVRDGRIVAQTIHYSTAGR